MDVLLNCLPQLEECLAFYEGFAPTKRADAPGEHLKKLVEILLPLREIDTPPVTHSRKVDILSMMSPVEQEQPQYADCGFQQNTRELSQLQHVGKEK